MRPADHVSWTLGALAALGLAALAAACATSQEAAPARAAATCATPRHHAAGVEDRTLSSGGETRAYRLVVPASYTGEAAVPLVLDLQMSGGSPEAELRVTGFDAAAETEGFIVAAPAAVRTRGGGGTTWNVPPDDAWPDDVAYVADLLDALAAELCIDEARVYAAGFSGGARFASELACRLPERFAAVAPGAGLRRPMGAEGTCLSADVPVSIIAFHGAADQVNTYAVEGAPPTPYWTYGVEEALARWAAQMECPPPIAEELVPGEVQRRAYAGCRGGADLVFYRIESARHVWPGGASAPPAAGGPVDATALAVAFFAEHAR